jgi:hypothetical protein
MLRELLFQNNVLKNLTMKSIVNAIVFIILFSLSSCTKDAEKIGACGSSDKTICHKNFTEAECKRYSKNKEDGKDWVFYEGEDAICFPPGTP